MLSLTEAAKKKLNLEIEGMARVNKSVIYTYALGDAKVSSKTEF